MSTEGETTTEILPLRTGAMSATIDAGTLRDIYVGEHLALLHLYVAIRDANWATVPGKLEDVHVTDRPDGFAMTFRSVHSSGAVSFSWDATIEGDAGNITFTMNGVAHTEFASNRIGFCLLHPLSLAGIPVSVRTVAGERQLHFPKEISPHQPFPEMIGMAHSLGGGASLDLTFEGELFETEDQRNWTDASYKTYCTPLRLPYPRQVKEGERIWQSVTLTTPGAAGTRPRRRPDHDTVVVTADNTALLPPLPPLGLGAHSQGGPLDEDELRLAGQVAPEHLRAWIDPQLPDWIESLNSAAAEAQALNVPLDIDVLSHNQGLDLHMVIERLREHRKVVRRLYVFDAGTWTTGEPLARHVRHLAEQAALTVAIGGGSTANFADLNRAKLPLPLLDVVTYAINPQVHAFDERSMMETLEAQEATIISARRLCGGLPLAVGPVTLRPRFNPVATGPQAPPPPGELPPQVDPRQAAAFTAAWTVGSVAALADADSVTYLETAGWLGLFARPEPASAHPRFPASPGTVFPVHNALNTLATMFGRPRLSVWHGDGRVAAIAVPDENSIKMLLANLTAHPISARISSGRHSTTAPLKGYGLSVCRLPSSTGLA